MAVTLHDIAEAAGVSVSTVSRALNDSRHPVNETTRQRIAKLAEQMGYRPNMVARGLRTDKTFTFGLVVDNISSPFTPTIIRGIQDHLKKYRYSAIIINTDGEPQAETDAIHNLISRSIDGVIFVESWQRTDDPLLDLGEKPFVFAHRLFNGDHSNSVVVDDRHGASLAVEHLLQLGHRRIAHVAGPQRWDAAINRLQAYEEMLGQAGVTVDPRWTVYGNWELQDGYRATTQLLALTKPPTAIFAANDLMALGAVYAIQEAGLKVPEDIAVVGYDNREIASLTRPTITTVTLPCYEMGKRSAQMLLDLQENNSASRGPVAVKGRLIVRESSGATGIQTSPDCLQSHTTPQQLIDDDEG